LPIIFEQTVNRLKGRGVKGLCFRWKWRWWGDQLERGNNQFFVAFQWLPL